MAQEIQNVDYESMVNKYINEWDGCNLREFCFSEKVNIYRMLKTMKKMGVTKDAGPHGLKPLEFSEIQEADDVDGPNGYYDDGCVHNEAVDYALREWSAIQNYLLTESGDFTNNICEREMRIVATLRNNSLFWGSHTSAERLSVILTIVRSALMNSLNVYQYIVFGLKTIRSYKGDLADLLANKWKPSDAILQPIWA